MWVKICGNTNLEDAALAAELGADAVGFVFAPSPRQVNAAQVAAITARLDDRVERVGVFDSHDVEEVAAASLQAGLTAVQLHGGLDEIFLERLAKRFAGRVRIIQTLHWTVDHADDVDGATSPATELSIRIERIAALGFADRVLIDSKVGAAMGGTGVSFNWTVAKTLFASSSPQLRLIAAGGLKPENVAQAIIELAPWGVDVSSGVETSPGRKDPARMKHFIENARGAQRT